MNGTNYTVVFCLPGNSFSGKFLECWTNLLAWCISNGIRPVVSRKYSCNIYYSRNMCLGGDVSRGPGQQPFDGKLKYDYLAWIDSDIVFRPQQFERLLRHDQDIVSGMYLMEGGGAYAAVKKWDEEFFRQHGSFRFITRGDISTLAGGEVSTGKTGHTKRAGTDKKSYSAPADKGGNEPRLIEVDYTGMGFMLVKYGVFERLDYPWFRPLEKRIGNMVDFTMEDVSFCLRAKEKGFNVFVDPAVKVGHEKKVVL